MASHIKQGESLLIPFRNGISISDSQLKPRMYKTRQAFEKAFPKHYLGTDGVELVEYAPVVHGRWLDNGMCNHKPSRFRNPDKWTIYKCSECRYSNGRRKNANYCPNCGAKMDGRSEGE